MMPMDDWRRQGQENYLNEVELIYRKYRQYKNNPKWDHDHCQFCWETFSLIEAPDHLNEGYTTNDDYHWICEQCFRDFKEEFKWTVRSEIDN